VFLASKVRPVNFRKPDVIRACEGSLKRLGTDHIDLYQLHWPNYAVPIEETMSAMEELANAGKIRFIGVSNFSDRELAAAQRCLDKYHIVSNQVRYSLMERTIEARDLPFCQREQVTVIAFSPFGTNFDSLWQHDPEGVIPALSEKYQRSAAQIALNWLLQKDLVVVIPKASSPEHVIDDCGASSWQMESEDCQMLSEKILCRRRGPVERFTLRVIKGAVQRFGRAI
jgi:diketogulonate reductase-like aldo/keto reductase